MEWNGWKMEGRMEDERKERRQSKWRVTNDKKGKWKKRKMTWRQTGDCFIFRITTTQQKMNPEQVSYATH
jgi:hypothetical protein